MARTVMRMHRPGNDERRRALEELAGVGEHRAPLGLSRLRLPPRKPRAAASRIAARKGERCLDDQGATQFGRMVLNIRRSVPAPGNARCHDIFFASLMTAAR